MSLEGLPDFFYLREKGSTLSFKLGRIQHTHLPVHSGVLLTAQVTSSSTCDNAIRHMSTRAEGQVPAVTGPPIQKTSSLTHTAVLRKGKQRQAQPPSTALRGWWPAGGDRTLLTELTAGACPRDGVGSDHQMLLTQPTEASTRHSAAPAQGRLRASGRGFCPNSPTPPHLPQV